MKKNSLKNKLYLENNGLTTQQFNIPKEIKKTFDMATTFFGYDMSEPLVDFILKYNSIFINHYGKENIPDKYDLRFTIRRKSPQNGRDSK